MTDDAAAGGERTDDAGTDGVPHDPDAVERLAETLRERGDPFVRATVVRREPPVSATVGDEAIITADGDLHGWVGGVTCARSVVIRESDAVLASGEPQLIGLAPDPEEIDRPGLAAFPMTCHSRGTVEIFLNPVVPAQSLVVVGDTPVAGSLARLAGELSYEVVAAGVDASTEPSDTAAISAVTPEAIRAATPGTPAVIAASMGESDVEAVVAGIALDATYLGLIASDRRAADVTERAAERLDVDPATVREAVTTPAGIDIGAETPSEIALSVLAEVVAASRGADAAASLGAPDAVDIDPDLVEADPAGSDSEPPTVVDPVCGMDLPPDEAAARIDHDGDTVYFCSQGCADGFERDPDQYTTQ